MDEAGGRPCGLLDTRSMQTALNKVSWNVVTRMSKEDQEQRNKMFLESGAVDDDEDTTLADFVHKALLEYLEEKGWPEGLAERDKRKIQIALKAGAEQLEAAVAEESSAEGRALKHNKGSKSNFASRANSMAGGLPGRPTRPLTHGAGGSAPAGVGLPIAAASSVPPVATTSTDDAGASVRDARAGPKKGGVMFAGHDEPEPQPQPQAPPAPAPVPAQEPPPQQEQPRPVPSAPSGGRNILGLPSGGAHAPPGPPPPGPLPPGAFLPRTQTTSEDRTSPPPPKPSKLQPLGGDGGTPS